MQIDPEKILKNERWLDIIEIRENLKGVQYIIMATPPEDETNPRIHFTLFLNTQEAIPEAVVPQIIAKFAQDHAVNSTQLDTHGLLDVAFSLTGRETPMPVALYEPIEADAAIMYVVEFSGVAPGFKESKEGLTGWSYVRD